jgi:hypothetical protein
MDGEHGGTQFVLPAKIRRRFVGLQTKVPWHSVTEYLALKPEVAWNCRVTVFFFCGVTSLMGSVGSFWAPPFCVDEKLAIRLDGSDGSAMQSVTATVSLSSANLSKPHTVSCSFPPFTLARFRSSKSKNEK